ncbi:MAG: hypothetical protein JRE47_12860 [Deltaproteobacteria bacterium]|nr:hypothetical protein [Deltaproteobacteria bacterium]
MNNLPSPISKNIMKSLFNAFVPESYSKSDKFELSIRLKGKNVSVRQFASYMRFLDKAYGRLTPKGLISYSRTPENELKIEEIRHGSLEIIISKLLSEIGSINALILVGLLLKFLPGFIKSTLSAYRDYEEGKLARARREQIKEQIKKDKRLKELSKKHIYQLTQFFDAMYSMDIRNLPKAHKFSSDTVIEVKFNIKSSCGPNNLDQSGIRKIRL